MSNLLNRNSKEPEDSKRSRIDSIEVESPSETFDPNNIFTISNKAKETETEKSTSIRLSIKNREILKNIKMIEKSETLDDTLNLLIETYKSKLEFVGKTNEKAQIELIEQIYSKSK